jgi:hypothetical protein
MHSQHNPANSGSVVKSADITSKLHPVNQSSLFLNTETFGD